MNIDKNSSAAQNSYPSKTDAETWFHILFGWFAAMSAMITVAALAIIS